MITSKGIIDHVMSDYSVVCPIYTLLQGRNHLLLLIPLILCAILGLSRFTSTYTQVQTKVTIYQPFAVTKNLLCSTCYHGTSFGESIEVITQKLVSLFGIIYQVDLVCRYLM